MIRTFLISYLFPAVQFLFSHESICNVLLLFPVITAVAPSLGLLTEYPAHWFVVQLLPLSVMEVLLLEVAVPLSYNPCASLTSHGLEPSAPLNGEPKDQMAR